MILLHDTPWSYNTSQLLSLPSGISSYYEDSIYNKSYLEKLEEEIHYHYHAYKVRITFIMDGRVRKCTLSNLFIENHFPVTFNAKGSTFESFWDLMKANPGWCQFTGASLRYPTKHLFKHRKICFEEMDYHTKPWREEKNEKHEWELKREVLTYFPLMKDLKNLEIERVVPYISERLGL